MTPIVLALPWVALLLFVEFWTREPSELPEVTGARSVSDRPRADRSEANRSKANRSEAGRSEAPPRVSVVVPARNEAVNIEQCLGSIVRSDYPDFEVIVVDDRSEDGTAELARTVTAGNARRIEVVDGEPLPDGWLGKPWACHQGSRRATGEVLLFTDADTTHGSLLMARAVTGLSEEGADLLTIVGRQVMGSFWERLVQPHIFLMMLIRFPDFERIAKNDRWRDAIANGQYLLFRRPAYELIGGHECVRDEVVEDLALAQHVKRAGLRLRIRGAEHDFATRMYRSLSELVAGWSKNVFIGGVQSFPRWMRLIIGPGSLIGGIVLWLAAPAVVCLWLFSWIGGGIAFGGVIVGVGDGAIVLGGVQLHVAPSLLAWAAIVLGSNVVLWTRFSVRMGTSGWYGILHPLGAAVGSYILLRSWLRGRTVEWKGRTYRLREPGRTRGA